MADRVDLVCMAFPINMSVEYVEVMKLMLHVRSIDAYVI